MDRDLLKALIAQTVREVLQELQGAGSDCEPPASHHRLQDRVLTERKVLLLWQQGYRVLDLPPGVVVTPLAREMARTKGVSLQRS